MKKPAPLTKRFNADGSLSVLCNGRVQARFELGEHDRVDAFSEGWFSGSEPRWGRAQFAPEKVSA